MKSCKTGLPSARTFLRDFSSVSSNCDESDSVHLTVLGGLRGPGTVDTPVTSDMYLIARGEVARGASWGSTGLGMTRTGRREKKKKKKLAS